VAPYESSIDSYLIGISRPNGEDELERLSATQLLAAKKSTAGIFSVDVNDALEKSGRDVAFAPASDYRMSFAGTMYLNSRGYVPLTSSVPVMNQDFVLSGTALSHLTVNVSQGTVNLTSKVDADDASSTRYTFPGLTPPGLSYIITWDQEESAELASRNGEIRTVNVSNDTRAQGSVL
jgi:hypothetical protein